MFSDVYILILRCLTAWLGSHRLLMLALMEVENFSWIMWSLRTNASNIIDWFPQLIMFTINTNRIMAHLGSSELWYFLLWCGETNVCNSDSLQFSWEPHGCEHVFVVRGKKGMDKGGCRFEGSIPCPSFFFCFSFFPFF